MSDLAVVLLAVVVVLGAALGRAVPIWIGMAGTASALVLRRPLLLVVSCGLLASGLAARAADGAHPLAAARYAGWVTLLGDPAPAPGGVKVVARLGRHHVELWAHGADARAIDDLLAGERVAVRGVVRPVPETSRERDAHRHVVARLTVDGVIATAPASPVQSRGQLGAPHARHGSRGVAAHGLEASSSGSWWEIGETSTTPPTARFEAAGLTHLLAVSGENVAFVLAAAGPLLRRFRLHGRAAAALVVIAFFATVTRFEPSVLRASAMAGLAAVAQATGRPASGLRLLALATAGLVLVDPFLVWSIGFRLSVGASLGILLLAGPITRRVSGSELARGGARRHHAPRSSASRRSPSQCSGRCRWPRFPRTCSSRPWSAR